MSESLSANMLIDEVLRGVAVAAVFRGVVEGKPVLSMGTVNFGARLAAANVVYSVARGPVNSVLSSVSPQLALPNGK
tara:strand:+ start:1362 stop:1592 length:231 start_codon:yes stop_codon:yes gene_type:complete